MGRDHHCRLKRRMKGGHFDPCDCISNYDLPQSQSDGYCSLCCINNHCLKRRRRSSRRRNNYSNSRHFDIVQQSDDNYDDQQRNNDCLQCSIKINYNDAQCRETWPTKFGNWSNREIKDILDRHWRKGSTTSTLKPETSTLKPETSTLKPETSTLKPETSILILVATLAILLVLAIVFILFVILWISFRRKRNSTPDDKFANSNVQNVNENSHPYEEINENTATSSFCNSSILDTTTNTRNISEETYEGLTEKSSSRYDKLVFNELPQVNNENRNDVYHVVEK